MRNSDVEPPFKKHRNYYLFVKVAVLAFVLWLVFHFMGYL